MFSVKIYYQVQDTTTGEWLQLKLAVEKDNKTRLIIQKSLHRLHFRKASAPVQRLVYTQCTLSIPNQRQELLCAAIQHGGKIASLQFD